MDCIILHFGWTHRSLRAGDTKTPGWRDAAMLSQQSFKVVATELDWRVFWSLGFSVSWCYSSIESRTRRSPDGFAGRTAGSVDVWFDVGDDAVVVHGTDDALLESSYLIGCYLIICGMIVETEVEGVYLLSRNFCAHASYYARLEMLINALVSKYW